jgi:hypothetical protein
LSVERPAFKACAVSKSLESIISERLRQHEIALSILAEYPKGLERFRAAIKQDNEAEAPETSARRHRQATHSDEDCYQSSEVNFNKPRVGSSK